MISGKYGFQPYDAAHAARARQEHSEVTLKTEGRFASRDGLKCNSMLMFLEHDF